MEFTELSVAQFCALQELQFVEIRKINKMMNTFSRPIHGSVQLGIISQSIAEKTYYFLLGELPFTIGNLYENVEEYISNFIVRVKTFYILIDDTNSTGCLVCTVAFFK